MLFCFPKFVPQSTEFQKLNFLKLDDMEARYLNHDSLHIALIGILGMMNVEVPHLELERLHGAAFLHLCKRASPIVTVASHTKYP